MVRLQVWTKLAVFYKRLWIMDITSREIKTRVRWFYLIRRLSYTTVYQAEKICVKIFLNIRLIYEYSYSTQGCLVGLVVWTKLFDLSTLAPKLYFICFLYGSDPVYC